MDILIPILIIGFSFGLAIFLSVVVVWPVIDSFSWWSYSNVDKYYRIKYFPSLIFLFLSIGTCLLLHITIGLNFKTGLLIVA